MKKAAIIIPSRLGAKRFPNKPLAMINDIPMIVHVFNRAKESNVGEVYVATPDEKIIKAITKSGGNALITKSDHLSGSDRVYEAYIKKLQNDVDLIVNLQGDMPNIKPETIKYLVELMKNNDCDIGTLASNIKEKEELHDENVVKVQVEKELKENEFLKAKDFFRTTKELSGKKIYHHIGIYAFTKDALTKYVNLARSRLEIERNLEQMRAMENDFIIKVGLSEFSPLGVDTENDLKKLIKEMN
tara:strand:+ start:134 stop:865 length:732 start_codon:yes stop_codon:yes gene_type:complete